MSGLAGSSIFSKVNRLENKDEACLGSFLLILVQFVRRAVVCPVHWLVRLEGARPQLKSPGQIRC